MLFFLDNLTVFNFVQFNNDKNSNTVGNAEPNLTITFLRDSLSALEDLSASLFEGLHKTI